MYFAVLLGITVTSPSWKRVETDELGVLGIGSTTTKYGHGDIENRKETDALGILGIAGNIAVYGHGDIENCKVADALGILPMKLFN